MKLMQKLLRPFLATTCALALGTAATAAEVELSSNDGLFQFRGELVSFEDGVYSLRTSVGVLNIPALEVTCIGADCPQNTMAQSSFRVVGEPALLQFVVPELLDGYSLEVDTDIEQGRNSGGEQTYRLLSFEGDIVVEVTLAPRSADAAISELIDGSATLALVTRPLTPTEARLLARSGNGPAGADVLERVIGFDGIVAVAGDNVPIDSLSESALARIFSGEVSNWSQFGGPDMPISVFAREAGSEVRAALDSMLLGPVGKGIGPNVISVDSNLGVAAAVKAFPNSIGITGFAAADSARAIGIPDACGTNIAPDRFSIKTQSYPLGSHVYFFGAPGDLSQHAEGLVEFASSGYGQQILRATGYIDVLPEFTPNTAGGFASIIDANAGPLQADYADYGALVSESRRLTTSFLLPNDGTTLDKRGEIDLGNLVRLLRTGELDGQEVVFVGLADGTENTRDRGADAAIAVAAEMLNQARDLESRFQVGFRVAGFADPELATCPDPDVADTRRVEVWVRPL